MRIVFRGIGVPGLRSLALAACGVGVLLCQSATARADASAAAEMADVGQVMTDTAPMMWSSPAQVVTKLKAWLQDHPQASARSLTLVYDRLAYELMGPQHDLPAAYAMTEEGMGRLGKDPLSFQLLGRQMQIMLAQNKDADVDALGVKNNDGAANEGAYSVLEAYANALQKEGKADELDAWCKKTLLLHPELLSPGAQGSNVSTDFSLYAPLITALLGSGHEDEALQWAKLQFVLCPFSDEAIKNATDQLAKVIVAKNLSSADVQAFMDAQKDPTKPNPLTGVATPIAAADARQALAAVKDDKWHVSQRIGLLLVAGANREAMLLARRHLVENMGAADGVGEICRVFKGVDLNLKRANDFLDYMAHGHGPNPVTEFLKASPAAG